MKSTQMLFVLRTIKEQGFITRNQCLRKFISRLGAYMCDLKNEGLRFTPRYIEKNGGKDFIYIVKGQKKEINRLIKYYLNK